MLETLKLHKPEDRVQEVHLGFNKLTKAHCSTVMGGKLEDLGTQYFTWLTREFNPNTHEWKGDMETGKVVSIGEIKPVTAESVLNAHCHQKIKKKYMYYDQINALSKMFRCLIDKGVLTEEDEGVVEFNEMQEYITRTLKNNKQLKAHYEASDDHEYLSLKEEAKRQSDCFHGGLQAIAGRPEYGPADY